MNDKLDHALRYALAEAEPDPDFAERVMARLPSSVTPLPTPRTKRPFRQWLPLGLAAALVMGVVVHQQLDARRERGAALEAKSQLLVALRITSEQLDRASRRLQEPSP